MTGEVDCESRFAIRKKKTARERRTGRIQSFPENFFIAKKRDSESAQRVFYPSQRLGASRIRRRSIVC
jgi:hypothetical protein